MNVTFSGRNIKLDQLFKNYAEEKINSLEKFLWPDRSTLYAEIEVELGKHHQTGGTLKCQTTIWADEKPFRAEASGDDLNEAFDIAFGKLKIQAEKHHEKEQEHR